MLKNPVGISSLAISFPSLIRTNDYWQKKPTAQPKLRRVRMSRTTEYTNSNSGLDIWSQAVAPYLADPFRGSVERRVLSPGESSLKLECQAARDALNAAQLAPDEVELAIAAAIFPDSPGFGIAPYLARELDLRCPAWNLESTCSSALIALQTASALIQTGVYQNALVVVSHFGSQAVDDEDSLSSSMGDAAGAFLVTSVKSNQGILACEVVHTAATIEAYSHEIERDRQGHPRLRTRTGENPSILAETAVEFVQSCCDRALAAANVTLDQIKFFVFNTPTAWYASVCARSLNIDPERTINLYPRYANIGPVFPLAGLYHAAAAGKIRENDLILVYTNGAAATAAATVMRWGDVALGCPPKPPINVTLEQEKIQLPVVVNSRQAATINREELLNIAADEQQEKLENYLQEILANLLQRPSSELNSDLILAECLDSLTAIMLKNRLEKDLQINLAIAEFFGTTTTSILAQKLVQQLTIFNLTASHSNSSANEEREILTI
ncbi:MAG: 3-oxoacyl-[acyl-carrier-protein] synthase III C-terminal domain-containing protein [Oscillatoria sp. PMC 1051.18]|nr:3-oxoacyl-[acyl-carrier-protein] synthase III C-terminal domain-containing protein [Oscillatoria sp. PMC 1050.18]MEC5029465.1 3-oxoacyl-[acyl-carrier-protein] synthase III C-terminal domain-containing protein [Oscillatoria sp. PMC 1051.18]